MNYANARSFREAVEQRIRNAAVGKSPTYVLRVRRRVVIERFLARLQVSAPDQWLLKGGMALEFRYGDGARSTRDVDLGSDSQEDAIVEFIAEAADIDVDDFFTFEVARTRSIVVDGEECAIRFRIIGQLDGRRFETVIMDVGVSHELTRSADIVSGSGLLVFAGIPPVQIQTLPLSQRLAEKLHAYTRIYAAGRLSSRVKDLVDIVLIVTGQEFVAEEVISRIGTTFGVRDTHRIASNIPEPPGEWVLPYREMAIEVGIDPDVTEGYRIAAAFFDPLLAGDAARDEVWSSDLMVWEPRS